ncbi:MAG TPA: chromate transporter [Acidiphilium sp.]
MPAESQRLSHAQLFQAFFVAGLSGFGAVLPFLRRIIVERRQWQTAAEFTDLFSLCQFLPGPNTVNFAAAFGSRHRGVPGAVTALFGLLAVPVTIVLVVGTLYERFGSLPAVDHALGGLAAGASGLILATALKIAGPSLRHLAPLGVIVLTFALFAVLGLPLPLVIAIALPVSVGIVMLRAR